MGHVTVMNPSPFPPQAVLTFSLVGLRSRGRPLAHVTMMAVQDSATDLGLELSKVQTYLQGLEGLYDSGLPYHNSIHAADVVNSQCLGCTGDYRAPGIMTPGSQLDVQGRTADVVRESPEERRFALSIWPTRTGVCLIQFSRRGLPLPDLYPRYP